MRLEWADFAEFDRGAFRTLRTRHGIRIRTIALKTPRPHIHPEVIKRWELGKGGSVSEAWRRNVYVALRQAMIEACATTIRMLRDIEARESMTDSPAATAPVSPSGFLVDAREAA